MYATSRLMFIVTILACGYSAAVVSTMYWPQSGFVLAAVVIAYASRRGKAARLTTLGSARWASAIDLRRAGMLEADRGLILGKLLIADRGRIARACKKAAAKKKAEEWMAQGHAPMLYRSNWKAKAAGLGAKVLLSALLGHHHHHHHDPDA